MEFKLTEDTLQRLEKKENITVRDIMGFVVQDICSDLQKGCGELTRLNLGNDEQEEEDAILFICNLARKLAKIQSRKNRVISVEETSCKSRQDLIMQIVWQDPGSKDPMVYWPRK